MLTSLNIVIGLAAVYTAFSLLASWIQERIAAVMQFRSKTLKEGIQRMVDDVPTYVKLLNQPSIIAAQSPKQRDPSYISATQFSMAVMGLIGAAGAIGQTGASALATLQGGIRGLPPSRLKDALSTLAGEANADVTSFISGIESWFDDQMDRVTGWYKRYTQVILLVVGAIVAAAFNVDTIRIADDLTTTPFALDQSKLNANTAAAEQYVSSQVFAQLHLGWPDANSCPPATTAGNGTRTTTSADKCSIADTPDKITWKVLGLLLTAVALSLGAPFWFDALSRFMNVRASGPPPAKSSSASST
jgi:hypothetical protein